MRAEQADLYATQMQLMQDELGKKSKQTNWIRKEGTPETPNGGG
jgi:hypothetical protein